MAAAFEQWEHSRNHQGRSKRGEHDEGRHRIDVTPNLRRHYRRCSCRRADDTGKHALPKNLLFETGLNTEDNPHIKCYKQHLSQQYTHMPTMGLHLMEIDTAESGKQRAEHHHGEDGIDNGAQRFARRIKLRNKIEREIDYRTHSDSHRQRPVLHKLLNTHHQATKG